MGNRGRASAPLVQGHQHIIQTPPAWDALNAAADEMNDLDPVFIVENSRRPVATTHYVTIEFDRDSRGLKLEVGYESVDGQAFRELARLPVDLNLHDGLFARQDDAAQLGACAFMFYLDQDRGAAATELGKLQRRRGKAALVGGRLNLAGRERRA